jgi:hypothetical protein
MEYYAVEPFGEQRADQRAAANTLFAQHAANGEHSDLELLYPYCPDPEAMLIECQALEARRNDPELQEKLKQARLAHIAAMKKDG